MYTDTPRETGPASKQARISELKGRTSYCMEEKVAQEQEQRDLGKTRDIIHPGVLSREGSVWGTGTQGGGGTAGEVTKLHDKRLGRTGFSYQSTNL